MAKPIGMRAHGMSRGKDKLAFDNLAIIHDDSCAVDTTSSTDASPVTHPKGKRWEKYALDDDRPPSTGRKAAKCVGILLMMIILFSLTAGLVIKDKIKAKRMHDFDERMKHTSVPTTHTETALPTTPSPASSSSSSPAATTANLRATHPVVTDDNGADNRK